jgi:hypothetical protein
MRPARLLSTPKRIITSALVCIPLLAASLLDCNAILGNFELGDVGDGGLSGSGSDGGGSDDGATDSSTDATTQTGQDGGSEDGATDSSADAADAMPPCPGGETYCSGSCVNLLTAPGDCGGCGHACTLQTMYGSSTCQSGVCSPVELIGYVGDQFVGVAADEGHVFVHVNQPDGGSSISECAAASCDSLEPFESDTNTAAATLLASGGIVAWWSQLNGFWANDDGGAAAATPHYGLGAGLRTMSGGGGNVGYLWFNDFGNHLTVVAAGGFNWTASYDGGTINSPISLDSANAVFQVTVADGGGSVQTCSIASGCTSPVPIGPPTPFAGVLTPNAYLGLPAPPAVDAGPTIAYVSLTPPEEPPVVLTRLAPTASLVQTAIDSTGFYWLDSAGNISMCPIPPATCPTSGVPVVRGATGSVANQFAVSNGSVFYITTSSPSVVYEAEPPP